MDADGGALTRTYRFKNYYETLAFVNALAYIVHREDHHPELHVGLQPLRGPLQHALGQRHFGKRLHLCRQGRRYLRDTICPALAPRDARSVAIEPNAGARAGDRNIRPAFVDRSTAARFWQATRRGRREDVVVGDWCLASVYVGGTGANRVDRATRDASLSYRLVSNQRARGQCRSGDRSCLQRVRHLTAGSSGRRWWRRHAAGIEALVLRNKAGSARTRTMPTFLAADFRTGLAHAVAFGQDR